MHDHGRRPLPAHARCRLGWCGWLAAPLLLALGLPPPCRADAILHVTAPGHRGTVSASAQVDFRITVLPSLGLSAQASGVRIRGNSGVMTLQRELRRDAGAGTGTPRSTQLQPHREVIDTLLLATALTDSERITIASP